MQENNSRRKFIQQTALLSAGIMLGGSSELFAKNKNLKKTKNNMKHTHHRQNLIKRIKTPRGK
jgi:hypothetical protein